MDVASSIGQDGSEDLSVEVREHLNTFHIQLTVLLLHLNFCIKYFYSFFFCFLLWCAFPSKQGFSLPTANKNSSIQLELQQQQQQYRSLQTFEKE
ncbi:hypothetical protein T11_6493 [Trichinella zimbabwensis]|uniref:Uncharacterized protein n=1 Tax=Trichinella zimbabwensis TaxID=268475 RepID=A0A0V1HEG1_9BILA|nr:hypothetical protein T11_6493 [Trichinella zimbabwensis]